MWVHEAGQHHFSACVKALFVRILRKQVGCGAGLYNLAAADEDCAILEDAQPAEVVSALRTAGEGE
jgi:hypothetical protein